MEGSSSGFVMAQGRRLEYRTLPARERGRPWLVFLHEGLGSLALWKDFPDRVAAATGCPALVYSRYGHGRSDLLEGARGVGYMHDEGILALPELLDTLAIERPLLVGHSDGASIALLHAGGTGRAVAGLVLMAPHVFVEEVTVASIAAAGETFRTTDLPRRLGRYHQDAERTFRGWNDIWLAPGFRDWNIEGFLPGIAAPALLIQGADDEYGSGAQLEALERGLRGTVERLWLADCKHSPHRDQEATTLAAIVTFVRTIAP